LRLLIVDDNITNRDFLTQQLNRWNLRTDTALNGPDALQMMRAAVINGDPYKIALLDMIMPEMSGLELAQSIKADANIAGTVLFLLGSENLMSEGGLKIHDVADVISKPVHLKKLKERLLKLLVASIERSPEKTKNNTSTTAEIKFDGKILLVEDNLVNQEVARHMLERLGLEVDTADNGKEAVERVKDNAYDLVLMDIQMPVLDGINATAEIRGLEKPLGRRSPIAALTANAMTGDREQFLAADMDDYLSKPFKQTELSALLGRWLKTTKLEQAEVKDIKLSTPPQIAALDKKTLDELKHIYSGEKVAKLKRLIGLYEETAQALLDGLARSIMKDDAEAVRIAAHSLKSASGNLAALILAEKCNELELAGRNKNLGHASELFATIEQEFVRVKEELSQLI